jgi:two-component system, chemotaxis family, CheB/CheR fusion protein
MPPSARRPRPDARSARPAEPKTLRAMTRPALIEEVERLRRALRRTGPRQTPRRRRRPPTEVAPAERQSTQEKVQQALDHYLDLYDFAPVTYVLLDANGLIVHINLSGCRMLDLERRQLIGHPLLGRVVPGDRRVFLEHMRRCRREKGVIESELRLQRADAVIPSRFYSKRSRFEGREVFPTIVTDLGEHLQLEEARLKALLERDQAERERRVARASVATKDKFLAMVSHELRTPLTPALIAAARLARWGDLPEHARKLAIVVKRNVEIEARLIDDLLDIARLGRGRLELRRETVDVHRAVRDALDVCAPPAEAKRMTLRADLGAPVHHARADESRLRQVFWNLLTNAVRFTDPGGSILVRTTNTAEDLLRVTVVDTGAGMDADALAGLFSPFEPADHLAIHESRHGLGLGLTICKGIMDAHGGHIWAMSEGPGRGSTFEIELPAFRPVPEDVPERRLVNPGGQPRRAGRLRVLVIEDDVDTSTMLEMFLAQEDCEVAVASRLEAGVRRLREGWDVVVSDIGLPDGSGLDIARRARALLPRPRLIALSGYGSTVHVTASRDAGFDDHLVKPVDFDRFLDAIHEAPPEQQASNSAPLHQP